MNKQIDPRATQEYPIYPDTPLNRVHYSLYAIRRCPICSHRIDLLHDEALVIEKSKPINIVEFELL